MLLFYFILFFEKDENKGKSRKSKVVEFEYNLVDPISVLPYENSC